MRPNRDSVECLRQKLVMPQKREIDLYHRDGSTTKTMILETNDREDVVSWIERCGFHDWECISLGEEKGKWYCASHEYGGEDDFLSGKYFIYFVFDGVVIEAIAVDEYAVLEFLLKYKPLMEG